MKWIRNSKCRYLKYRKDRKGKVNTRVRGRVNLMLNKRMKNTIHSLNPNNLNPHLI